MFELSGHQALVKSCRGRRGKADDAVRAMVFVLEVENVAAANVAALFGVKDAVSLHPSFFEPITDQSTTQDKLYPGIAHIASSYYAEGKHQIKFGKFAKERMSWLGSLTVTPRMAGKFDVRFLGTIDEPQPGLMDAVVDHINRCMRVVLECDPGFEFNFKAEAQSPVTMELPLEPTDRDMDQLDQAARGLESPTAEVPLRGAKRKSKPAKKSSSRKASGKRSPKKKAG